MGAVSEHAKKPDATKVGEPIAVKDLSVDTEGSEFPIDSAVLDALPHGYSVVSAVAYGSSAWTTTARIIARDHNGDETTCFLKTGYGEGGGVMLKGEFESAKIIHTLMPGLIPAPLGHGRYTKESPQTYFYLSEFVVMETGVAPDPVALGTNLASLHRKGQSPNGKFGFHVVTCDGKLPHAVEWQSSWVDFFGQLLDGVSKFDLQANGPWPSLERATKQVITQVVPRLLGDLKDGRTQEPIRPSILHGDLWEPNLGVRKDTNKLVMYDVGSYWAHNEMDLGVWRADFCDHFRTNFETYTREYLRHYPAAIPREEFDDRNRLYSLKASLNYSAGHPGSVVRETVYNNMCYLCEKYAPADGLDAYDAGKDPMVSGVGFRPDFTKRD